MKNRGFAGVLGKEYKIYKTVDPLYEQLQRNIKDTIENVFSNSTKKSIKVLDIGCGIGLTAFFILSADKRIRVVSVDNEIVMIKQIGENLKEEVSKGRLEVVHADALEYVEKSEDESFDIIASCYTIHNFEQKYRKRFLKESFRILKPGGIFVNSDKYIQDNKSEFKMYLDKQMKRFEKFSSLSMPKLTKEWKNHMIRDTKPDVIMMENESIRLMESLGFKNILISNRKELTATLVANK